MPATPTAPWESKRRPTPQGVLRKVITWSLGLAFLGFILYSLQPKPIQVELVTVTRGPLTVYVTEEGKTRIRNRYVVSAPTTGQMHRVVVRAGDPVTANETLLTIIEPSVSPLLDPRARAQAEARVQVMEAARLQANQSLSMARTNEKFAMTNWERVKNLIEKGSISHTDRDSAEREAAMRQHEVRSAEFALKVAEFEQEQAKAALVQINEPNSGSVVEVRSPVSGRVLKVLQESAMVVAAGTAILEIGDPTDLEIEAEILSRDTLAIQPGAAVTVEQWGGEESLQARVRRVEPAAFTKVSALGVEEQRVIVISDFIQPSARASALGDRYRVEVKIAVWHEDHVLLVPAGALFREGSDWKVFVLSAGKAVATTVEVGRTDGRMTQVLSGLSEGTQLLLHPPDTVRNGVAVVKRTMEG